VGNDDSVGRGYGVTRVASRISGCLLEWRTCPILYSPISRLTANRSEYRYGREIELHVEGIVRTLAQVNEKLLMSVLMLSWQRFGASSCTALVSTPSGSTKAVVPKEMAAQPSLRARRERPVDDEDTQNRFLVGTLVAHPQPSRKSPPNPACDRDDRTTSTRSINGVFQPPPLYSSCT